MRVLEEDIQTSVDKAMKRIAAAKAAKSHEQGPKEHELLEENMGEGVTNQHGGYVIPFDDMYTTSRLWEAFQVIGMSLLSFTSCIIYLAAISGHQFNDFLGYKLHMKVLWNSSVRVWDPGGKRIMKTTVHQLEA